MVHIVICWSPENHHQPHHLLTLYQNDTSQGNQTSYKTGIQHHLYAADYDGEIARRIVKEDNTL